MISLIAAIARNNVIGDSQGRFGLPWHIPADLKRFKALTMDKPIIFGRTTWELIEKSSSSGATGQNIRPRPLPGRRVIVLSHNPDYRPEGVEVAASLGAALKLCEGAGEVFIAGGAKVYEQALPLANRLYITEVGMDAAGDTYFPALDCSLWRETAREPQAGDPEFAFVTYARL